MDTMQTETASRDLTRQLCGVLHNLAMVTPIPSTQLTDEELDELDQVLARVRGGEIPNVEALDGFLTALVICPDLIRPSEYMGVITSGESEDDDLVFDNVAEAERFYGLVMRQWNVINGTFRRGEIYLPVLAQDGTGNDWANGFIKGTHLRHGLWEKVVNSEERGGSFVPIWALAYEHASDPSLRPYKEPISQERRQQLLGGMIAGVKRLYDGFEVDRQRRVSGVAGLKAARSFAEKVGRNDSCPCGSGKKFKKCCGHLTLH